VSQVKSIAVALTALLLWVTIVVSGALFGWWRQPIAPRGDASAFMRAARGLVAQGNRGSTALVLIEDGAVTAEHFAATERAVDRNTVFATASMSKWITAWAVMKLVEERRVDLDRPVEDYLSRWKLPDSRFDHRKVTVRRLLSHTAGLTDGLGFGDYRLDEAIPTLEQSLTTPRASSGGPAVIAVGVPPGEQWRYSGGGFLLLELLVEEVSGEHFDAFVKRSLLRPLGMTRSGYGSLSEWENSAGSFDRAGRPAPTYRYASKGATGFTTSASDLARFALAQLSTSSDGPLAPAMVDSMRTPHASSLGLDIWGLGTMLYAPTASGAFIFGHDGANDPAINATVRINPDTRDAIVVLSTGGRMLASALGAEWVFWQTGLPDLLSISSEVRRVVPALLGGAAVILLALILYARRRRGTAQPRAGA